MRTLLVEDDLATAHAIATRIEAADYACDVVSTTTQALDFLRHTCYRVAILDYYLQGETSLFLASHMRLRHPQTKIITITGSALFANGYGLDRLSTDFIFRKPFPIPDLVEIVKYLDETSEPMEAPAGSAHSVSAM